jgi:hypothetical protein
MVDRLVLGEQMNAVARQPASPVVAAGDGPAG